MLTLNDLETYQISPATGFVPASDPLLRLPAYYAPWEQLGDQMAGLLTSGQLRPFVDRLPLLTLEQLADERARQ